MGHAPIRTGQTFADQKREWSKLEQNKVNTLPRLKKCGGPFTDAEEIDEYMNSLTDLRAGQSRMRDELTYARDSSRAIPRTSPFLKMMTTDTATGKRRLKTAAEFAVSLKILLGRQTNRKMISNEDFESALLQI